jgi:hypothetical protein
VQGGPLAVLRTDFSGNAAGAYGDLTQSNGGAIYANQVEPLRMINTSLVGNYSAARGGALYTQDSTLLLTRTAFLSNVTDLNGSDGQGGAVYAGGALADSQVVSSTFLSNYASRNGGAFYQSVGAGIEPIPLTASTFAWNRSRTDGAALHYFQIGSTSPYTLEITNSTFFSNTGVLGALDAIATTSLPLALNHVTLSGAGEGIEVSNAGVTVDNSILNSDDGSCDIISGTLVMRYSASADPDCHFGGSNNLTLVAHLGALQDNGGAAMTRLPFADDPVLDAIPAGLCLPGDQRGTVRPQGAACDMGAVELAPADPQVTLTPAPTAEPSITATPIVTGTSTQTPAASPTSTPTATSTSPATQTAVAATATAQATLTPQPSPSSTPMAQSVYLSPVQNGDAPRP